MQPAPTPPGEVKEACSLILGSFALACISFLPVANRVRPERQLLLMVMAIPFLLLFAALTVWLVVKIRRRANWARWAMLIFLGSSWLIAVSDLAAAWDRSPLLAILIVVTTLMEVTACWLLFFGPGGKWFAERNRGDEPQASQ